MSHPCSLVQVHVLRDPSLEELPQLVQNWRPTLVYVSGGVPEPKAELHALALPPLRFLHGADGARGAGAGCLKLGLGALLKDMACACWLATCVSSGENTGACCARHSLCPCTPRSRRSAGACHRGLPLCLCWAATGGCHPRFQGQQCDRRQAAEGLQRSTQQQRRG